MSKAGKFCLVKLVLQDCWNTIAYFDIDEEKMTSAISWAVWHCTKVKNPRFSVIIILKPEIAILLQNEKFFVEFILFFYFPSILFSINCFHTQHILHKVQYLFLEKIKMREDIQTDYSQATYTICLRTNMFLDYSVHRKTETLLLLLGRFAGKMKGLCC